LVAYTIQGEKISSPQIHFKGFPVSLVFVDKRTSTWWVGISHRHWGEKLHYSNDCGSTWNEVSVPSFHGYEYRPGKPASLKKLWTMQSAGNDKPNCLWLGTEPGGLFFSDDNGKTFHLNESLWNHPSRLDDNQWFGTGKDFPFIHSILVDPNDSNHIYVSVSCAGVFETLDGGKNWKPKNNGLIAGYLPKAKPEIGHDPHQVLMCQQFPNVIWQQNHCGIFRTSNGGEEWINVSSKNGGPSYGFAMAIDDLNPDVAWVIPAESDEVRTPIDLKLQVFKTVDGGKNWSSTSNGLPNENAFDLVLRHGFVSQKNFMAFGTTNGNLYGSFSNGDHWQMISQNLAPINSLTITS
jgi:hypothetical protein